MDLDKGQVLPQILPPNVLTLERLQTANMLRRMSGRVRWGER